VGRSAKAVKAKAGSVVTTQLAMIVTVLEQ
jgi:hypothetical protein